MDRTRLTAVVHEFLSAPETDSELVRKYMSDLQSQNERLIRRSSTDSALVILLAIFFLLVSARGVGKFSLLGVEITQYDAFELATPAVIAALIVRIMSASNSKAVFTGVYFEISKQVCPAFSETSLDSLAIQSETPFTDEPDEFWKGSRGWALASILSSSIIILVYFILPIVFFAYSYYTLFHRFRDTGTNVFVWLSLLFTVSLLILAMTMIFADVWETDAKTTPRIDI